MRINMWLLLDKIKKITKKKKIYFADIADGWLELKKNAIKESTYFNYAYNINKHLKPRFKGVTLRKLKKYNFNDFIEDLLQDLSPKTVREITNVLKQILKYASGEYNCNFKIDSITSPRVDIDDLRILSRRERGKLERYCMNNESLRNMGILICLYTGLRIGEICALKWENIDLDKKIIYVRHTLQRVYDKETGKTKVIIDKPKTKKSIRSIPISNKLYSLLQPIKKQYTNEDFFLTGSSEKYIEPRNYQYIFKRLLKDARIKSYKFHILRHTFATECIEVGMDIKSLSEILGHANSEVTLNRYVHSSYKAKKRFLEKL